MAKEENVTVDERTAAWTAWKDRQKNLEVRKNFQSSHLKIDLFDSVGEC